jgi:hypothetical protein
MFSSVAQHYIAKPLLIDNKKFDLRIYVLLTSCKPLRMYLFRDGLVRICTEDFVKPNENNLDDKCMHLTNYAINKTSEKFDQNDGNGDEGSKRSIKWFLEYMKEEYGDSKVDVLWDKIGAICTKTIISILPTLVREYDALFGTGDKGGGPATSDAFTVDILGKGKENKDKDKGANKTTASDNKNNAAKVDSNSNNGRTTKSRNSNSGPPARQEASSGSSSDASSDEQSEGGSDDESDDDDSSDDDSSHSSQSEEASGAAAGSTATASSSKAKKKTTPKKVSGSHCFEILGLDIMIDEKLKPFLIEVNHLPSFGTDSSLDEDIKSRVVEQALSVLRAKPHDRALYTALKKRESEKRLLATKAQPITSDNTDRGALAAAAKKAKNILRSYSADSKVNRNGGDSIDEKAAVRAVVPSLDEEPSVVEKARLRIIEIYEKECPHKVSKVGALLKKYQGKEEWIVQCLEEKYGLVSSLPVAAESKEEDEDDDGSDENDLNNRRSKDESKYGYENDYVNIEEGAANEANAYDNDEDDDDGSDNESSKSSASDEAEDAAAAAASNVEDDPVLIREDRLLLDFDRIYPIPKSARHKRLPNYEAMKTYIFEQDVKRQMRLKCPLQQRKNASAAEYDTEHVNNPNDFREATQSRGDGWISGNAFGRKAPSVESAPAIPKAMPSSTQIKAADRLSRGWSVNEKKKVEKVDNNQNSDDASWYLSDRVLRAAAHAKEMRRRIENNSQKSVDAIAVKPVVFEFAGHEQFAASVNSTYKTTESEQRHDNMLSRGGRNSRSNSGNALTNLLSLGNMKGGAHW